MSSEPMEVPAKPTIIQRLVRRYYPHPRTDPLDALFCKLARAGMAVLDAGCGGDRGCSRDAPWQRLYIVGTDCASDVGRNRFCNSAAVSDLVQLPFADCSFDLIHCRWVLEHLPDPLAAFREFARILKPGGRLLVLTPNLFHYATMAARLTPHRFHRWWWRERYEPFPTYYRANSPHRLRRLCDAAGLHLQRLELVEGSPDYLIRFWPAFLLGVLYERTVNSTGMFASIRHRIVLQVAVPATP